MHTLRGACNHRQWPAAGESQKREHGTQKARCLLAVPAAFLLLVLSVGLAYSKADDEMRLAIAPFESTLEAEGQGESAAGLGATIAEKLTALFIRELSPSSRVTIINSDVTEMAWDQAGLAQMGLVDDEDAAKLGDILQANYIWCGAYAFTGNEISVEATLWSIQRGAAEPGFVAVVPRSGFVVDIENIDALSCALFGKMYELIAGERASVSCPGVLPSGASLPKVIVVEAPFLVSEISGTARVGITTVGMGIVNNIIATAAELNPGLELSEIGWAYEADLCAGYGFAPGLDVTAGVKLLQASRNAGASANVSMEVSSVAALLGLTYHLRVADVDIAVEGRAGWAGGSLAKNDQWGYLACPSLAAAGGMAFETALTASLPLNSSWSLSAGVSYRGMGLTGPFVEVPMLDFSGVGLQVSVSATLGGHYPGVDRGAQR